MIQFGKRLISVQSNQILSRKILHPLIQPASIYQNNKFMRKVLTIASAENLNKTTIGMATQTNALDLNLNSSTKIIIFLSFVQGFCQWKMLTLKQTVLKCHFLENVSKIRSTSFFPFLLMNKNVSKMTTCFFSLFFYWLFSLSLLYGWLFYSRLLWDITPFFCVGNDSLTLVFTFIC